MDIHLKVALADTICGAVGGHPSTIVDWIDTLSFAKYRIVKWLAHIDLIRKLCLVLKHNSSR